MLDPLPELNEILVDFVEAIQSQQTEVNRQRDGLEVERRQIAGQRLTESRLGPVLRGLGIVAVCALTLGFCYSLVMKMYLPADDAVGELLLEDLVSDEPKLLPIQSEVVLPSQLPKVPLHRLQKKEETT